MVKHELRVTSCELRVESLKAELKFKSMSWNSKARVEIQIHELRVQIHKLRIRIHELQVRIHELPVRIHEFKNH